MIMSLLTSVTGVFPGASVSDGDLTLPSGSVVSFTPVSATDPGGSEMVFGLCETMYQKVSVSSNPFVKAQVNTVSIDASTLRRTYTFSVDLDLSQTGLENLNVKK
jgi:hypothetical protein